MGLFSSKTVTIIDSSSNLLIEDTPDVIKDSITTSILNNSDIGDDIVANYMGSLYSRGKQLRRYAKNKYTYGLPDGTINYPTPKDDIVRIVLKNELGTNVFIVSNVVDVADALRFSMKHLIDNRGYDRDTQIVSNPPFVPSSPEAVVYVVNTYFASNTSTRIEYQYTDELGEVITETEDVGIQEVSIGSVYYHTTYYPVDGKGNPIGDLTYWFYSPVENKYPSLDLPLSQSEGSQYFPIVPIRQNKQDMADPSLADTPLYKTSRRLLNMWDISFTDLSSGVHESPDIDSVDHAYFMVGVDIADDHESVLDYLHTYFGYLYGNSKNTKTDFLYWQRGEQNSPPPVNTVTVKDGNYRMDLNYTYIDTDIRQGVIGAVGEVQRSIQVLPRVQSKEKTFGYEQSVLTITKQITPNYIEEFTVHGLIHLNYVYANDIVTTTLKEAMDDVNDKNNFIIPLNSDVVDNMVMKHSLAVFYYAIRIVFNTKIEKKLKWYQTSFFQFFIKVVAIVITIYGGYQLGLALMKAASVGIIALAQVVLQAVLISVAANYAMDFLVNAIGLEAALVIAVIISAVALNSNTSIGSLGSYKLPTAIDLLQVSSALNKAYQGEVQDEFENILKETKEFEEYSESLIEELDALDTNAGMSPLARTVFNTTMGNYETPEEFLNRTTYNDNIGVLSLETVETFVDRMLKLDIPTNEIRTQI